MSLGIQAGNQLSGRKDEVRLFSCMLIRPGVNSNDCYMLILKYQKITSKGKNITI
jgi:hypothetical protein